jgi:hypothetical protein
MKNCAHADGTCYPKETIGSAFGRVGGCPRYSTDITASCAVVEKMREKGFLFQCHNGPDGGLGGAALRASSDMQRRLASRRYIT